MGELRADAVTAVDFVVPGGIDDPTRPSGGNSYDRRICRELAQAGWTVRAHPIPGDWPGAGAAARGYLREVLVRLPDRAVVLIDGLIGSAVPQVLSLEAGRLRIVVLVHMPFDDSREAAALAAATAILTTSDWTRRRLLERYPLAPGRVHVAEPGVDPAAIATGTAGGGELLCVAAVTPLKGHDVLLGALATVHRQDVRCHFVGSLTRDPGFVARLRTRLAHDRLEERVCLTGPLAGADLDAAYAAADVLVSASRAESYGMVIAEALARGLPVIATAVGAVPETLGAAPDGSRPGLLVPAGEPGALAVAVQLWLDDGELRRRLRRAAGERRAVLVGWSHTTDRIATVLAGLAA